MAHIELETTINAPAGAIFDLLRTPDRRPEWMTNLHAVRNVTGNQVGDSWEYTYTMLGRPFTGKVFFREMEAPHHMKLEATGGIEGTQEWRLTTAPDGTTLLRFTFDYTVPALLGGVIADKLFIERQNERQLQTSLAHLQALAEHEQTHGRVRPSEPHAESVETALQVLRERMGNRWVGREGAGHAEMVRILQEALGYDKHWANTVIASLIHTDRLHYHPAGEEPSATGGRAPALYGPAGVSGGVSGSGLAVSVGYWQVGPEYE